MSAMFTVTWFQRHNEMTALMAAGISRIRILAPVIVAAIAILVLAAVSRETLMPRFRVQMSRQAGDLGDDAIDDVCSQRDNCTDVSIGGKRLFLNQQRIEAPKLLMPRRLRNYGEQLTAENAFFRAPRAITRPDTCWTAFRNRRIWPGSRRWSSRGRRS